MKYTVVGVFLDSDTPYQRYAEWVIAKSPADAEAIAIDRATGDLVVAAVFEGYLEAVDNQP